jgi:hypothetical protein
MPEPITAATRNALPRHSAVSRARRLNFIGDDLVDIFLDCHLVNRVEGQTQKHADPTFQRKEGIAVSAFDFLVRSLNCGRIGKSPVSRYRVTWPDRTYFIGGVVTDGEHEVHLGRFWLRKFVPTLASEPSRRDVRGFKLLECTGPNRAGRMIARAVGRESWFASGVHQTLRHD